MKKLLGVSIVAMLAVTPMLANAAGTNLSIANSYTAPTAADPQTDAPITDASPKYAAVTINTDDQGHIASTAYVKGAYNSTIAAINKVATDAAAAAAYTEGNGIDITNKSISVDAASNGGITVDSNGVSVNAGNGIAVDSNGVNVNYDNTTIGLVGGDGANKDKLEVKTDGTTITKNAISGALEVGSIGTGQIAAATLVTSSEAIGAIEGTGAATDDQIPTAKAVRAAINASAGVQSVTEGSTNGTVDVDGTNVAVHGLGSAAYTASTDYATAAQGALADSAVQSVTTGATDGTISVDGTDVAVYNGATQTGVNKTIESSYVTLYTDWKNQTYTKNVGITAAAYTTGGTAIPAGVSGS